MMKRFATWLWKEWRDQRAVTLGILGAIPALTALAYWAFGERIGAASLANVRPIFLGIAVGLVVFAIAGDLFAGENRRSTIQALRRLPGSMAPAFLAKLTYLAVLLVVVVALQGVSLAVAENLNAPQMAKMGMSDYAHNGASRSLHLFHELAHFPGSTLWLTGLGFSVLGLWTLLVSSWMGRSGVAAIGALVVLAALATPFVLFFKAHPWFFPGPYRLAAWAAAAAALVATLAAALSFLRGQRFVGRPLRPFLLGAAVLLVALGGSYAYAHQQLRDWLEITPQSEDFRIFDARYGAGGKHLFLTVHRGTAWSDGRPMDGSRMQSDPWHPRRGTPMQAWVVDLKTGAHRTVDERAVRYFQPVPENSDAHPPWPLDPIEALVCYRLDERPDGSDVLALGWWDARSAKEVRVLPSNVRDQTTVDLVRRELAQRASLRDAQGRRVWMRGAEIEHEGQAFAPLPGLVAWNPVNRALSTVPGGWVGYHFQQPETGAPSAGWHLTDVATGTQRDLALPKGHSFWTGGVLSMESALVRVYERKPRPVYTPRWQLFQASQPSEARDPKNLPDDVSSVIGENLVLALRGDKRGRTLHAWNPLTGADRPLAWGRQALEDIAGASAYGKTGDGRLLLQVRRTDSAHAWVLLDAAREHLRVLRGWHTVSEQPLALLEDHTLVLLEDNKRVIRYPTVGGAEILFPKP